MKRLAANFLVLIVAASSQTSIALEEQVSRDIETHIWALEKAYVTAYKNADHDSILALMHDQFLGWPDSEERPMAYLQVARFLNEKYGSPGTSNFRIDRAGIRILGDVAITHYVLIATANDVDDSSQAHTTRITHAWIREDSDWKILGGMSNVQ